MENNNDKENIKPAYEKKKESGKKENLSKKQKKVKSKISKIIIITVAILLVLIVGVFIYKFISNNINKTNVDYLSNMKAYGFDQLYDNKTATPEDQVTKSEAIKMVIASMLNENDVTRLIEIREYIEDYNETMSQEEVEKKLDYKNKLWVEYAELIGVVQKGEVTKENANTQATFLECLVYFANAKTKILNDVLDTKNDLQVKNIESYRVSEQLALNDMIYNEIIENKDDNFKRGATKKEFNKLLIDMVIKYNTITVEGEKININKDKEPSNVKEYPYTLASVDKKIYELENYVSDKEKYKNAKDSYADTKKYYYDISSIIQDYMNTILNVNYESFDEKTFKENILNLSFHYEKEEKVDEYIKYVKDNKIKISGNAKVQYPAIYFDGESYRVRVKINYKVENANVKEDLIYKDISKEKVKYEKDEEELIVDVELKKAVANELMYIKINSLKDIVAGKVKKQQIVDEEKKESDNTQNSQNANFNNVTDNFIPTESEIVQDGDTLIVTPK